jgi:uncharacterized membrane protein YdbT with pleckstrin-like domain
MASSKFSEQLIPGEFVLIEVKQHIIVLLLSGMFVLPIFKWLKTAVAITNKRIIATSGIFRTDTFEARLNKVAAITFAQSLMGKILNYGTITIRNMGGETFNYPYIQRPKEIRRIYNEAVDEMEKTKHREV